MVAEDLCSETFFRALRNMTGFRWQGKDFGAWLMTIARNLATDHFKKLSQELRVASPSSEPVRLAASITRSARR